MILGTYGHISFNHIERYLSENTFRYNRRAKTDRFLFEDFIGKTFGKRIDYKELTVSGKMAA